mmetsp:Transcript_7590/g.16694  ORF Transcript_7590/g.16694 Transcript_7590/m.16694 type:complete len:593 (-) Transcript_7590:75-1853(-)
MAASASAAAFEIAAFEHLQRLQRSLALEHDRLANEREQALRLALEELREEVARLRASSSDVELRVDREHPQDQAPTSGENGAKQETWASSQGEAAVSAESDPAADDDVRQQINEATQATLVLDTMCPPTDSNVVRHTKHDETMILDTGDNLEWWRSSDDTGIAADMAACAQALATALSITPEVAEDASATHQQDALEAQSELEQRVTAEADLTGAVCCSTVALLEPPIDKKFNMGPGLEASGGQDEEDLPMVQAVRWVQELTEEASCDRKPATDACEPQQAAARTGRADALTIDEFSIPELVDWAAPAILLDLPVEASDLHNESSSGRRGAWQADVEAQAASEPPSRQPPADTTSKDSPDGRPVEGASHSEDMNLRASRASVASEGSSSQTSLALSDTHGSPFGFTDLTVASSLGHSNSRQDEGIGPFGVPDETTHQAVFAEGMGEQIPHPWSAGTLLPDEASSASPLPTLGSTHDLGSPQDAPSPAELLESCTNTLLPHEVPAADPQLVPQPPPIGLFPSGRRPSARRECHVPKARPASTTHIADAGSPGLRQVEVAGRGTVVQELLKARSAAARRVGTGKATETPTPAIG